MLVLSRASVDFIRRWILLHISARVNISLLSDFLIKLMRLPMSFFDTKMTGDLLQRIHDHERVERFLTAQTLTVLFSAFSFVVFGGVLLYYNRLIFFIFVLGSALYAVWVTFDGKTYMGMLNIGVRPTIDNGPNRTIEVNILHFHSDIYDKFIRLTFVKLTGPELKFSSIDELITQLHKDAEETETILKK